MALERDQLTVDVEIDSSEASKSISNLESQFLDLNKAIGLNSTELTAITKAHDVLQKELNISNKDMKALNKTVEKLQKNIDISTAKTTTEMSLLNKEINSLKNIINDTDPSILSSGIDILSVSFQTLSSALSGITRFVSSISDLILLFETITNPATIKRLSGFVLLLSDIAESEGFILQSKFLKSLSKNIDSFGVKLQAFNKRFKLDELFKRAAEESEGIGKLVANEFNTATESISTFDEILQVALISLRSTGKFSEVLKVSLKVATASIGQLASGKVTESFLTLSDNAGVFVRTIKKSIKPIALFGDQISIGAARADLLTRIVSKLGRSLNLSQIQMAGIVQNVAVFTNSISKLIDNIKKITLLPLILSAESAFKILIIMENSTDNLVRSLFRMRSIGTTNFDLLSQALVAVGDSFSKPTRLLNKFLESLVLSARVDLSIITKSLKLISVLLISIATFRLSILLLSIQIWIASFERLIDITLQLSKALATATSLGIKNINILSKLVIILGSKTDISVGALNSLLAVIDQLGRVITKTFSGATKGVFKFGNSLAILLSNFIILASSPITLPFFLLREALEKGNLSLAKITKGLMSFAGAIGIVSASLFVIPVGVTIAAFNTLTNSLGGATKAVFEFSKTFSILIANFTLALASPIIVPILALQDAFQKGTLSIAKTTQALKKFAEILFVITGSLFLLPIGVTVAAFNTLKSAIEGLFKSTSAGAASADLLTRIVSNLGRALNLSQIQMAGIVQNIAAFNQGISSLNRNIIQFSKSLGVTVSAFNTLKSAIQGLFKSTTALSSSTTFLVVQYSFLEKVLLRVNKLSAALSNSFLANNAIVKSLISSFQTFLNIVGSGIDKLIKSIQSLITSVVFIDAFILSAKIASAAIRLIAADFVIGIKQATKYSQVIDLLGVAVAKFGVILAQITLVNIALFNAAISSSVTSALNSMRAINSSRQSLIKLNLTYGFILSTIENTGKALNSFSFSLFTVRQNVIKLTSAISLQIDILLDQRNIIQSLRSRVGNLFNFFTAVVLETSKALVKSFVPSLKIVVFWIAAEIIPKLIMFKASLLVVADIIISFTDVLLNLSSVLFKSAKDFDIWIQLIRKSISGILMLLADVATVYIAVSMAIITFSNAGAKGVGRLSRAILLLGDALNVSPTIIATVLLTIDQLTVSISKAIFNITSFVKTFLILTAQATLFLALPVTLPFLLLAEAIQTSEKQLFRFIRSLGTSVPEALKSLSTSIQATIKDLSLLAKSFLSKGFTLSFAGDIEIVNNALHRLFKTISATGTKALSILSKTLIINVNLDSLQSLNRLIPKTISMIKELGSILSSVLSVIKSFGTVAIGSINSFVSSTLQLDKVLDTFNSLTKAIKNFTASVNLNAAIAFTAISDSFVSGASRISTSVGRVANDLLDIPKVLSVIPINPLFNLVETLSLVSVGLEFFGNILVQVDNKVVRFIGNISLLASKIAESLLFGFRNLLKVSGELSQTLGVTLINKMIEFGLISEKASLVTKQFEFSIRSFGDALGVDAVGSIQFWNEKLEELRARTTFATADIEKSITILSKEANILGLTATDTALLLDRASEVAAANAVTIQDATGAIVSALTGQSQSLLALGVDLRESSVTHGELAEEIKGVTEEQRSAALQSLRFNSLINQTTPIVGAAALAYNTLSGQTERLNRSLKQMKIDMGRASAAQVALVGVAASLLEVFEKLPDVIFQTAGTVASFGGVILTVGGFLLEYALLISGVSIALTFLSTVVATNVTVQELLTFSMAKVGAVAGVQTAAVTGLSVAWTNLLLILRGGSTLVIPALVGSLKALASALLVTGGILTKTLLSLTPLVAKLTAFLIAIGSVLIALKELGFEIDAVAQTSTALKQSILTLGGTFEQSNEETEKTTSLMEDLGNAMARTLAVLIDIAKILGGVLVASALLAGKALANVEKGLIRLALSGDEEKAALERINNELIEIEHNLDLTKISVDQASEDIANFGSAARVAALLLSIFGEEAEETGDKVKKSGNDLSQFDSKAKNIAKTLADLIEANRSLRTEIANIGAGNVDAIRQTLSFDLRSIEIQREKLSTQGDLNEAVGKELDLQKELTALRAGKQIEQVRLEATQEIIDKNLELANQIVTSGQQGKNLLDLELGIELAKLQAKRDQLVLDGVASEKALANLDQQKKLVRQISEQKLFQKQAEGLASVKTRLKSIQNQQRLIGLEGSELARQSLIIQLDGLADRAKGLKKLGLFEGKKGQALLTNLRAEFDQIKINGKARIAALEDAEGIQLADVFQGAAGAFDSVVDGLSSGVSQIASLASSDDPFGLVELPNQIAEGFRKLPEILSKAAEAFVSAIDAVISELPRAIIKIIAILPEIIDKVFSAFNKLFEALPNIALLIADALPALVDQFLAKLPEFIDKMITAIGRVIGALITALPDLVVNILARLPEIVQIFIASLIGAVGEIVAVFIDEFIVQGGAVRIGIAISKAMSIDLPLAIVVGVVEGIKRLAKSIGGEIVALIFSGQFFAAIIAAVVKGFRGGFDIPPLDVEPFKKSVDDVVKKVSKSARKVAEDVFALVDLPEIGAGADISDPLDEIGEAITLAGMQVASLWDSFLFKLKEAWLFIWEHYLAPFINALKIAWLFIWDNFISPIGDAIKAAWLVVFEFFQNLPVLINNAWDGIKLFFTEVLPGLVTAAWRGVLGFFVVLKTAIDLAFSSVIGALESLKDNIDHAFSSVLDALQSLKDNIDHAFSSVLDFFNNLKTKIDAAFSGVSDIFKPFNESINKLLTFKWPEIPTIPGLGGGGIGGTAGQVLGALSGGGGIFAEGGLVKQPGFVETPGEFVLREPAVAAIGADTAEFINRTGSIPGRGGGDAVVNIQSGAIQINMVQGETGQDVADNVINEIRRRTLDGEFIVAQGGIRAS
jgi:hypothetical protein